MIRADADLVASLEARDYHPLWTRYQRITPHAPRRRDAPMLWRWRDFEPFAARAATEVPIEDIERRAIIMTNPAFGGETVTTANLIGAFTILEPGDHARPHRHTAAAIRFATRAEGAVTIVNGERCEMHAGDLVLTPPMCWHGHINEGNARTVWFDAANMPLVCGLEASFFEPATPENLAKPLTQHAKVRYPGAETRAQLDTLAADADGSKTLRYINPTTDGAVMATLDCYATRLRANATTRALRATYSQVVLVVSGEGESQIGDQRFEWSQHDVLTVPQWTWATHTARSSSAEFFIVSDYVVMEKLELLRIERG